MKRRIAYFLVTTQYGGAERTLITLLRHLDRGRFEPIVYLHCGEAALWRRLEEEIGRLSVAIRRLDADGIPQRAEDAKPSSTPATARATAAPWKTTLRRAIPRTAQVGWYHWRIIRELAEHFRNERLDIIHVLHTHYPSLEIPMLAAQAAGVRIRLSDLHTDPTDPRPMPWIRRLIARAAARSATAVRVLNQRMAAHLRIWYRVRPARLKALPLGVDVSGVRNGHPREIRTRLGVPIQGRVVAVIGRLSEEKGHDVLIEAITRMRPSDHRYLFIGEGPSRSDLEHAVTSRGLAERVKFLGFQDDVAALLAAVELVVIPSRRETGPFVLLEAMAAGKPVIATDVGFVREVLNGCPAGRIVPVEDARSISEALEDLLRLEQGELDRMGAAGRRLVEQRYSTERMIESVFALYEAGMARS